ncbi:MAG: hypothetical protein ABI402_16210 [Ferruginibacter sp.]
MFEGLFQYWVYLFFADVAVLNNITNHSQQFVSAAVWYPTNGANKIKTHSIFIRITTSYEGQLVHKGCAVGRRPDGIVQYLMLFVVSISCTNNSNKANDASKKGTNKNDSITHDSFKAGIKTFHFGPSDMLYFEPNDTNAGKEYISSK